MMNALELGRRLTHLMSLNDLSEVEVLLQTAIDRSTYDNWVIGAAAPGEADIKILADYFGCDDHWLATGIGEPYGHSGQETIVKEIAEVHESKPVSTAMAEIVEWISEQNDGIDYWEVAKAKLAMEFPEFREWMKKKRR